LERKKSENTTTHSYLKSSKELGLQRSLKLNSRKSCAISRREDMTVFNPCGQIHEDIMHINKEKKAKVLMNS
jgi:hypothetical protein